MFPIQLTGDETIDCKNLEQVFSLYFGLNLNLAKLKKVVISDRK